VGTDGIYPVFPQQRRNPRTDVLIQVKFHLGVAFVARNGKRLTTFSRVSF
jgi:hypothetical protein